jgi:4-hydroxy-3-polyprenylbenzoate decarboxylase
MTKRIIMGVTGATGAPLAHRVLELMGDLDVEVHLLLSKWGMRLIETETPWSPEDFYAMANVVHKQGELGASISSGSYRTDGMMIVPCSMKTLASVRTGASDNLIARAADVVIKEGRKLVLVPRECPLSPIHLENMHELAKIGVTIFPPVLGFYYQPTSIDDMVTHLACRILDQFGLEHPEATRWDGGM